MKTLSVLLLTIAALFVTTCRADEVDDAMAILAQGGMHVCPYCHYCSEKYYCDGVCTNRWCRACDYRWHCDSTCKTTCNTASPCHGTSCTGFKECVVSAQGNIPQCRCNEACQKREANVLQRTAHLRWLELREGKLATVGYFPKGSNGSGVTIGVGIDLGQQSPNSLKKRDVSPALIKRLSRFLNLTTRQAVHDAGLKPDDLVLTLYESITLSDAFAEAALTSVRPFAQGMSQKGLEELASLHHWAGSLSFTKKVEKLAVRDGDKKIRNFVWEAIKDKNATDAQLKQALETTRGYLKKGTSSYNRVTKEIGLLP